MLKEMEELQLQLLSGATQMLPLTLNKMDQAQQPLWQEVQQAKAELLTLMPTDSLAEMEGLQLLQ
jgi:hypothetical protein